MSKPLTIEELKTLQVGDWVWLEFKSKYMSQNFYAKKLQSIYDDEFAYDSITEQGYFKYDNYDSSYGTKILAYKNKEQAETKGEIIELPCKMGDTVYFIDEINDGENVRFDILMGIAVRFNIESDIEKEVLVKYTKWRTYWHNFRSFGETCFTDKSEAERRLSELRGGK